MSGGYKITDQNALYFLTITVIDWLDVFTRPSYKHIVVDSLNHCSEKKGLTIFAWCLMSNHLHLMARAEEDFSLSSILRDFKKYTAKKIYRAIIEEPESRRKWLADRMEFRARQTNRNSEIKFWEDGNHPIYLENKPDWIDQKLEYIHQNPVKAEIVGEPHHYLYSSAMDYAGEKGLVDVTLIK